MPQAARLLFLNDPGVEGEAFLYQSTRVHLEAGEEVVFAVTDRPPSSVLRALAAHGVDLDHHRSHLHILDAYSPLLGMRDPDAWAVPDPTDLHAWGHALQELRNRHPGAVLMIDSLSTLADQIGVERFLSGFARIKGILDGYRLTAALFTRWPYEEGLHALEGEFDAVVRLQAVQERIVMSQYFSVARATWQKELDHRPRLYKALGTDGVVVYIPKIVVTGPFNAGKSTFVKSVSETAVSVERQGTTIALDHGSVMIDGLKAEVFGTPGQSRFDPILKIIAGQSLGVVVVVDATKPDSFPRARAMMDQVWRHGLPVIIAANKQDLPGALTTAQVRDAMQAPPHVQVVPCLAEDPDSARAVIVRLIDAIMAPGHAHDHVNTHLVEGGAPA